MRSLPFIATVVIAANAMTPAQARDRKAEAAALAPIPGAKAESCIQRSSIRETRVRDDSTIDFYMSGGKIYRSTLPNACPSLGFEEAFGYSTSIPQLCSTDIITVIRSGGSGIPGPSCGLGVFQPVQAVAKASGR